MDAQVHTQTSSASLGLCHGCARIARTRHRCGRCQRLHCEFCAGAQARDPRRLCPGCEAVLAGQRPVVREPRARTRFGRWLRRRALGNRP